jgi:hypothetical protein
MRKDRLKMHTDEQQDHPVDPEILVQGEEPPLPYCPDFREKLAL